MPSKFVNLIAILATAFIFSANSYAQQEEEYRPSISCARLVSLLKMQGQLERDIESLGDWVVHPRAANRNSAICMYLGSIRGDLTALGIMAGDNATVLSPNGIGETSAILLGLDTEGQRNSYNRHNANRHRLEQAFRDVNNPFVDLACQAPGQTRSASLQRSFEFPVLDLTQTQAEVGSREEWRRAFSVRRLIVSINFQEFLNIFNEATYMAGRQIIDPARGAMLFCGVGFLPRSSSFSSDQIVRRLFLDEVRRDFLNNETEARGLEGVNRINLHDLSRFESLSLFTLNEIIKGVIVTAMRAEGACPLSSGVFSQRIMEVTETTNSR